MVFGFWCSSDRWWTLSLRLETWRGAAYMQFPKQISTNKTWFGDPDPKSVELRSASSSSWPYCPRFELSSAAHFFFISSPWFWTPAHQTFYHSTSCWQTSPLGLLSFSLGIVLTTDRCANCFRWGTCAFFWTLRNAICQLYDRRCSVVPCYTWGNFARHTIINKVTRSSWDVEDNFGHPVYSITDVRTASGWYGILAEIRPYDSFEVAMTLVSVLLFCWGILWTWTLIVAFVSSASPLVLDVFFIERRWSHGLDHMHCCGRPR